MNWKDCFLILWFETTSQNCWFFFETEPVKLNHYLKPVSLQISGLEKMSLEMILNSNLGTNRFKLLAFSNSFGRNARGRSWNLQSNQSEKSIRQGQTLMTIFMVVIFGYSPLEPNNQRPKIWTNFCLKNWDSHRKMADTLLKLVRKKVRKLGLSSKISWHNKVPIFGSWLNLA